MQWVITYIKAVWVFLWANRDLIEKHVAWLKVEMANRKAEKAVIFPQDKSTTPNEKE